MIEPDVTDPGFIERLTDYWEEMSDSPAFWRVLVVGIVMSIAAAFFIVTIAAEPMRFEFAESPQPVPPLGVKGISIPIGTSPVEVERRCSVPGEMEQCEYYCEHIDRKRRPEPGWNPMEPIWLRSVAPTAPWTLQQAVLSCDVRTIDGQMTLECRCFDPGTRT